MLTQIKLADDPSQKTQTKRTSLKVAIKLAEKEQQDLIDKLQQFHDPSVIKPILNYGQEKTQLQKLLDLSPYDRNKRVLKKIQAELTYLRCFQAHSQEEDMPKEVLAIMKRDMDMLTAVITKFVHPKLYPKASIIESVANQRRKVRILLRGDLAVFEPINYKSFKNCAKFVETNKFNKILMETLSDMAQSGSNEVKVHFDSEQNQFNELVRIMRVEDPQLNEWQDLHNNKTMNIQTARNLLKKVGLITPTTPHRLYKHLKRQGDLICSQLHHYIIDQPGIYEHTAICLSQCYILQLQYEIYKQAIQHLNSDEEKQFIEILLKTFETMDYFDAKQYVRNQFMIDKRKEEKQEKKKIKQISAVSELEKYFMESQGRPEDRLVKQELQSEEEEQKYENKGKKKKKKKQETDLQTFEIKYDNDLYLIAQGEVTLQIDIISEKRLNADLHHSSKVRTRRPHSILKLYQGDLFGFEQLGKTKEYNLRYIISKDSKILLMSQDVYVKQYYDIPGFKETVKNIQKKRNKVLNKIIEGLQKSIQQQELIRYQSVAAIERHLGKGKKDEDYDTLDALASPRRVQYVGKRQFQREEEKLKLNIVQSNLGKANNVNLRKVIQQSTDINDIVSYASVYKIPLPQNCTIIDDYIEVRDTKGTLLRRRSIANPQRGLEAATRETNSFLKKIGVMSEKERVDHNYRIVKNRKSKYQIDDFDKEKKQFDRLKKMASSLPKLKYLYAKKEDRLYRNMNKLNYEKPVF